MASPGQTILEVCQVPPAFDKPESSTEFSLPLTFLDLIWFRFPPVQRLFFYQLTDLTPAFFNSVILPKLKHSLSLTLLHYLPLAGQVIWPPNSPQPIIIFAPNDGVQLTVAESDADMDRLSGDEILVATELHPYVPKLAISDTKASILALQVTLFPNKGFSIGYEINHSVLDGTSITMFMKAWAYISKHGEKLLLSPELSPFYDRNGVKDPNDLGSLFMNKWQTLTKFMLKNDPRSLKVLPSIVQPDQVRFTLKLNSEELKKIKKKILYQLEKENPIDHLSNFVATCAFVLVCMAKAKQQVDENKIIWFLFNVDCRQRLDPPLPNNYFGNCVAPHSVIKITGDLIKEENILSIVAKRISERIKELESNGVLDGIEKILVNPESGVQAIGVAGSTRFGVYGCDFGWGRPKKVEVVSIDSNGSISLNEGKDGNGVEIGLATARNEMEILCSLFVNGLKDLF